jgi:hypothetical protein
MGCAFIYKRITATPTAAYPDPAFPAKNANDRNSQSLFKTTSGNISDNLVFTDGSMVNAVALINHNLASASISHSTNGSSWVNTEFIPIVSQKCFKLLSSNQTYAYKRVSLSVASGIIQVGEVYIGQKFVPSVNHQWGHEEIPEIGRTVEEINGRTIIDPFYERKGFKLTFQALSDADKLALYEIQKEGQVVFIPETSINECYLGTLSAKSNLSFKANYFNQNDISMEFWEDAFLLI